MRSINPSEQRDPITGLYLTRDASLARDSITGLVVNKEAHEEASIEVAPEVISTASSNIEIAGCFSAHKAGNTAEECEDAYAWNSNDGTYYFAISDGATESSFSRQWARELVENFVRQPVWNERQGWQGQAGDRDRVFSTAMDRWLVPLQHNWEVWLQRQDLVWFAKRKAEQGTCATLIGLEIAKNNDWQALAVGDSCLFVMRDGSLLHSFPLQSTSELNTRPHLISTQRQEKLPPDARYIAGKAQMGDRFYLVTDALADWILACVETSRNPWVQLDRVLTQASFSEWVENLRDRKEMKNDDATMLHITVCR